MPSVATVLLLAAPAVLGYFFQIRPRRRHAAAQALMQGGLRLGDRVVTRGGTHATVVSLGPDTVDLEMAPATTQRCDRAAIDRLLQ